MPWIKDEFIYTKGILKAIAENYSDIYSGLPLSWKTEVYNPWLIAEYKADFDRALSALGKGHWNNNHSSEFKNYKHFGRLQQIIIADIIGIKDDELEGLGFYNLLSLRRYAYWLMIQYLNTGGNRYKYNT